MKKEDSTLTVAEKASFAKILIRKVDDPALLVDIARHTLEQLSRHEECPEELKILLAGFIDFMAADGEARGALLYDPQTKEVYETEIFDLTVHDDEVVA